MGDELCNFSARQLSDAYSARSLSPVEVAQAILARIENLDCKFNAFALVDKATTLRMARNSEQRWMSGDPLGPGDGIPTTIKDVMLTRGWPTFRGSNTTIPGEPWIEETACVTRLREAGAVFVGKTTTPEFAWKALNDSPRHGVTRNPWDPSMTSGGSSGGSAVAAALGMGVWHAASDAAGSIRIPAAFCGVVGFKPTYGVVPLFPSSAFSGLGHHGPIARTVKDLVEMLAIMKRPDPRDATAAPDVPAFREPAQDRDLAGLTVGFAADASFRTEPDIRLLVAQGVREMEAAGARVEEIKLDFADAREQIEIQWQVGCAILLESIPKAQHTLVDGGLIRMAQAGRQISATVFRKVQLAREDLASRLNLLHQKFDLLVTPTVPVAPFQVGSDTPPDERFMSWLDWTPFSYPFNLSQQPAVSVPCGTTPAGLPAGLQIVGPRFGDHLVLQAAQCLERALVPPLPPHRPLPIAG
jgi:Asp-tRNA(Asn)/Glu-tRNA(Gln) amidotransferase A subunit family amidase